MENAMQVRNEYQKTVDTDHLGMPKQRAEQQGTLPATKNVREDVQLLAEKMRSAMAEGIPQIVELEAPVTMEGRLCIRF